MSDAPSKSAPAASVTPDVAVLLLALGLDLFDDIGRGTTIFEVQHHDFAAVGPDLFAARDLFRLIVAAFYQQIRQNTGNQSLRRILFKETTQSTDSSAPSTIIRCSSGLTGRLSPFRRLVEASLLTATIRRSPNCARSPDKRRGPRAEYRKRRWS